MMIRSVLPASAHLADKPCAGTRADDRAAAVERCASWAQALVAGHAAASART